jgi:hypothetical protein
MRAESERMGPAGTREAEALRASADLLAKVLDTMIPIPGTTLRLGVDPLLGLIPGIGDTVSSLIGSMILVMAARLRVPKIVLIRMSLNVVLNGVIGAIPGLGDLFSVWFRSNARNAGLLRRAGVSPHGPAAASDWAFVVGVLLGTLALIVGVTVGLLWLLARLWHWVQ